MEMCDWIRDPLMEM